MTSQPSHGQQQAGFLLFEIFRCTLGGRRYLYSSYFVVLYHYINMNFSVSFLRLWIVQKMNIKINFCHQNIFFLFDQLYLRMKFSLIIPLSLLMLNLYKSLSILVVDFINICAQTEWEYFFLANGVWQTANKFGKF